MKKIIQTVAILIPLLLLAGCITGCAAWVLPSKGQMHELSQDTNSIHLEINTIYGSAKLDRNLPPGTSLPVTFQVQPSR